MDTMYYVSKDYLVNVLLLTRDNGTVAEEYSYDACLPSIALAKEGGRRHSPTNWSNYNVSAPSILYRGYTGHSLSRPSGKHLDEFALINMNGRVYDPVFGRFLSVDNYVQSPGSTQAFNRYSYCLNNPLKFTDPSGQKFKLFNIIFFPFAIIMGSMDFVGELIETGSFKKAIIAWGNTFNSIMNFSSNLQDWIFKGNQSNYSFTTGQPGTLPVPTTVTLSGKEYCGYYFDDLKSMVNFMWSTSNDTEVDAELSAYVLYDEATKTYYYWLNDWYGNDNQTSDNPYQLDPNNPKVATFDGKRIIAQIHTHPISYYQSQNNLDGYDGPSYKDYRFAVELGINVYSIGPHTVSQINVLSEYYTPDQFINDLAGRTYPDNPLLFDKINPFFFMTLDDFLNAPRINRWF